MNPKVLKVIKINPDKPEPDRIAKSAQVIIGGGVIGYPTETVYGLGCNIYCDKAVQRVFKLKKRKARKPLSVIIANRDQLNDLVLAISPIAEKLIQAFWPGPLTLIFKAAPALSQALLAKGSTIGVRIPGNPICLGLLKQCGTAIVSTSANLSGDLNPVTAEQVIESFGSKLDLVIDGGPAQGQVPSTVVDTTEGRPIIRRVGAISKEQIEKFTSHFLFYLDYS